MILKLRCFIPHTLVRIFDAISYRKSISKHKDRLIDTTLMIFLQIIFGGVQKVFQGLALILSNVKLS